MKLRSRVRGSHVVRYEQFLPRTRADVFGFFAAAAREWVHTHTFADAADGTIVRDEVAYRLPLFPAGEMAWPIVRLQIERIFSYRRRRLAELLGTAQDAMSPRRTV